MNDNDFFMSIALKEAQKAYYKNEVPVGAVIVYKNKIIAKAHNLKEKKKNIMAHAEMIAIQKAEKKLKNWRLYECKIYVTLEPCPMCASAIQQSRIAEVYFALENNEQYTRKIVEKIFSTTDNNSPIPLFKGNLEKESRELLSRFFKEKRIKTNVRNK